MAPGYAYAWSNKGNAYIALGDLEKVGGEDGGVEGRGRRTLGGP